MIYHLYFINNNGNLLEMNTLTHMTLTELETYRSELDKQKQKLSELIDCVEREYHFRYKKNPLLKMAKISPNSGVCYKNKHNNYRFYRVFHFKPN